jgi:uncharacterized protein YdeI (YjbR/CyaY-like superfamily)
MAAKKKPSLEELERVHPKSRKQWRTWLERNHLKSPGVWLVTYKKETGKPRIDYAEAVEELLCFGWVDSKASKLDDERSMLLCTPRKPKSAWSRPNKERVARLTAEGLMAPRGVELVELAKRTGTWDALNDVEALVEPEDLKARLDTSRAARTNWDAFPRSVKRGILEWILNAKRPETRQKRIEETVSQAAKNLRANQWRQ